MPRTIKNTKEVIYERYDFQVWFNEEQVVDYVEQDEGIARSGIICVQIHGGPPSEARYKDIQLREL